MDAAVGSPIDVTYKFDVAPDAPAVHRGLHGVRAQCSTRIGPRCGATIINRDADYAVESGIHSRVHANDVRPEAPVCGTGADRGRLYSVKSQQRAPLGGENTGDRSIRVATFNMQLPANALFIVFRDGWHDAEVSGEAGSSGSGPEAGHALVPQSQAGRHLHP
jgi:hypothetical protein